MAKNDGDDVTAPRSPPREAPLVDCSFGTGPPRARRAQGKEGERNENAPSIPRARRATASFGAFPELLDVDLHLPERLLVAAVIDRTVPGDETAAVLDDGMPPDRQTGIVARVASLHRAADPLLTGMTESGHVETGLCQKRVSWPKERNEAPCGASRTGAEASAFSLPLPKTP